MDISEVLRRAEDQDIFLGSFTKKEKPKVLSFEYRNTDMGGFSDSIVISLRTKKPIKSRIFLSRTKRHGRRTYYLIPAKYLVYSIERSNSGHLYCTVSIIRMKEEGGIDLVKDWEVFRQDEHLLMLDDLPEDIRQMLVENKDSLPLFDRVFPSDPPQD